MSVGSLPSDLKADLAAILGVDFDAPTNDAVRPRRRASAKTAVARRARPTAAPPTALGNGARDTILKLARSREATIALGLGGVVAVFGGISMLALQRSADPLAAKLEKALPADPSLSPVAKTTVVAERPRVLIDEAPAPSPTTPAPDTLARVDSTPQTASPNLVGNGERRRTMFSPRRIAEAEPRVARTSGEGRHERAMMAVPQSFAATPSIPAEPASKAERDVELAAVSRTRPPSAPPSSGTSPSIDEPDSVQPVDHKVRSRRDAVDALMQLRRQF